MLKDGKLIPNLHKALLVVRHTIAAVLIFKV